MANAIVTVHGDPARPAAPPTLLGQQPARIPTGGKIRPGIKVLSRKAAEKPQACTLYDKGVQAGQSFDQIERAITEALPELKTPLVPRNVPWFTVRPQDFPNPEIAGQILSRYGEDRGEGHHLYRFPVVFPADAWQSVMPHELACWGAHDKRYWSEYSPDGRARHCMTHAPVPLDAGGLRTLRLFGGRKTVARAERGGLCDPESCAEYQQRQCNLTGRFLFFIPGIRSIAAFELHTNSFYAMNAAIQKFESVAFMRGGHVSGFLDRQGSTFFLTKRLMEVSHIDEQGRAVRVPQWIIELEAPVDVTALLRHAEDDDTALAQARHAAQVLEGPAPAPADDPDGDPPNPSPLDTVGGPPTLDQLLSRVQAQGIEPPQYLAYANHRWGTGWKLNPRGRSRAWEELERHRNDPDGYRDRIAHALQAQEGVQP
jgi:hypothetical protein